MDADATPPRRDATGFEDALRGDGVAIIAEIKRRSPSAGALDPGMNAAVRALEYERGGAAAISVLTEPKHFGGSASDLVDVARSARIPVLRKDFHVDVRQLEQARMEGASAVLLIARALSPDALPMMQERAGELGLETLVEVRSEWELDRALDAGARIIGVNSRDLETLAVDPGVPQRLIPRIPPELVAVWESGVRDLAGVARAADHGADAVLIGSALAHATDPVTAVGALTAVARQERHG